MKLTEVQKNAVDKIVSIYNKKLNRDVQFVAPTGSGKTFMIANVISNILKENLNKKIVFIVFTISTADLPKQFKYKLDSYQDFLDQKYNVDHKESPSNSNVKGDNDYDIHWKNHDVLIFGTSSFGKNTIFTIRQKFKDLILELKESGHEIIYIRDEAHRGDTKIQNKKEIESEQEFVENHSSFIIKMTATPDAKTEAKQVVIYEKDLNAEDEKYFLIKNKDHLNVGFTESEIDNDDKVLNTAIEKFKTVKREYFEESKKINLQINPAMLIQVDSKNQYNEKVDEHDNKIDEITKILDKNNLSWVIYFSDRKESSLKEAQNKKDIDLNKIAKNDSAFDVVIFKIGPATGWDIPRACMLVQLRKISSTKLNQQTVGRIKRNPDPSLKNNELFRQYWIYSQFQEKTREIHKYKLKEKFKDVEFNSIKVLNKKTEAEIGNEYIGFIKKFFDPYLNEKRKYFIEKVLNEFSNNNDSIIVKSEKASADKGEIKPIYQEKLENTIDMKKHVLFEKKLYKTWLKYIENELRRYFNNILEEEVIKLNNINLLQLETIFYRDYITEINNNRKRYFASKNEDYFIDPKKEFLPDEFIIYEGKEKVVTFDEIEEIYGYKYVILGEDGNEQNIQYLDSEPEMIFFNELKNRIVQNKEIDRIEVFAKNFPLQSKIYFEYWNYDKSEYAKSYVDFIIKFKNINTTFYIEVKSKDDYNKIKTESIDKAFNLYKKIEDVKKTMILMIAVVDKDAKTEEKIQYKNITILSNDENLKNESKISFDEVWNKISNYKK